MLICYRGTHRARADMSRLLCEFSVQKAKCFDERDRLFVADIVTQLYGSAQAFEDFARQELFAQMEDMLGGSIFMPYLATVRICVVWGIHFCFDDNLMFPTQSLSFRVHLCFGA